jgi:hypothetical protein
MKTLNDLRAEYGWFIFPEREELAATIERIDKRLQRLMPAADLAGFRRGPWKWPSPRGWWRMSS